MLLVLVPIPADEAAYVIHSMDVLKGEMPFLIGWNGPWVKSDHCAAQIAGVFGIILRNAICPGQVAGMYHRFLFAIVV